MPNTAILLSKNRVRNVVSCDISVTGENPGHNVLQYEVPENRPLNAQ